MKSILYLFFICIFICSSCKNKRVDAHRFTSNQRQWIKPNLWIKGLNELYNFPYWFDDSLIASNRIHTIQQKEYSANFARFSAHSLANVSPDKITTYTFDESGNITSLKIQLFNDGVHFTTKTFHYTSPLNNQSLFSNYTAQFESSLPIEHQTIRKVLLKDQTPNYISYFDTVNSQYIYFVTNTKLTSPISIDTMLRPNPTDILVIPNLTYPQKIYSVSNKILESNVHEFQYDTFKNLVRYSYRQSSSKKEITLNYSSKGYLNGFTGKIFSGDFLIKEFQQIIQTSKDGRPLKIYENTQKKSLKKVTVFLYD